MGAISNFWCRSPEKGVRPCGSDPLHAHNGVASMPRTRREDHEGAWQHVMNRGIDRGSIFSSNADRMIFFDCLAGSASRFALQVQAFCLLSNHYHLLLFSEQGRLSDGMRFLAGRYTQRINYRDGRDGPIFRGRFASVRVKSEAHLVRVSRYIHRNPVEAGLVQQAWDWRHGRVRVRISGCLHRRFGSGRIPFWSCSKVSLAGIGRFWRRKWMSRRGEAMKLCHGVRPAGSDPRAML